MCVFKTVFQFRFPKLLFLFSCISSVFLLHLTFSLAILNCATSRCKRQFSCSLFPFFFVCDCSSFLFILHLFYYLFKLPFQFESAHKIRFAFLCSLYLLRCNICNEMVHYRHTTNDYLWNNNNSNNKKA